MLGKGEKRKFDEHEDGLEGKILAPSDGPSKVSYTLQRQTIFNISLMKLYNHRPLTEPSLQKTVLINNMLRRIQEELKQEGSLRPALAAAAAPAPPPPPPPGPLSDSYREAPPALSAPAPPPAAAPPPPAGGDPGSTTPLDACLTPASLLEDDDDGTFCTSPAAPPAAPLRLPAPAPPPPPPPPPPPAPEKDSFASALDEIEELCPTPTSPGAAAAAGPDGSRGGAAAKPDDPKLMDPLPGNFEITTSTGFLTDLTLDDILFADIDTSMYDFDPCTSAAGTASKMAPVSVSADDLLKTLAPYSSQPVAPSQPFKMDLTELDHIMEVLVGS